MALEDIPDYFQEAIGRPVGWQHEIPSLEGGPLGGHG